MEAHDRDGARDDVPEPLPRLTYCPSCGLVYCGTPRLDCEFCARPLADIARVVARALASRS